METSNTYALEVTGTSKVCPIGEKVGRENIEGSRTPVLSCEGACIRGEIARLAANIVAKEAPFRRGCHGELFAAPHSAMARWVQDAEKVVLIDGCFMGCHGRIIENLVGKDRLVRFDALSVYKKYTDRFDIDSVPEAERIETARQVADAVLAELKPAETAAQPQAAGCCGKAPQTEDACS